MNHSGKGKSETREIENRILREETERLQRDIDRFRGTLSEADDKRIFGAGDKTMRACGAAAKRKKLPCIINPEDVR